VYYYQVFGHVPDATISLALIDRQARFIAHSIIISIIIQVCHKVWVRYIIIWFVARKKIIILLYPGEAAKDKNSLCACTHHAFIAIPLFIPEFIGFKNDK